MKILLDIPPPPGYDARPRFALELYQKERDRLLQLEYNVATEAGAAPEGTLYVQLTERGGETAYEQASDAFDPRRNLGADGGVESWRRRLDGAKFAFTESAERDYLARHLAHWHLLWQARAARAPR